MTSPMGSVGETGPTGPVGETGTMGPTGLIVPRDEAERILAHVEDYRPRAKAPAEPKIKSKTGSLFEMLVDFFISQSLRRRP